MTPAPARQPLTDRQFAVLRALAGLYLAAGRMPSHRELCDATGISSPNGLVAHLRALERKGYVRLNAAAGRAKGSTRGIEVVGLAEAIRPAAEAFLSTLLAETDLTPTERTP